MRRVRTKRRGKADMAAIRAGIYQICEQDRPTTVRHVFYGLVSLGLIAKTENEYKATVVRLTGEMREAGELPWDWLVDSTRWVRKPRTHDSVEDALRDTARFYRRALWKSADSAVQVWAEKDAVASVLYDVTEEFDVPLMVARGYSSKAFLRSTAEDIVTKHQSRGQRTMIYQFGDYDPNGEDALRHVRETLHRYVADVLCWPQDAAERMARLLVDFEHAAVTPDQIADIELQTRPTKQSDSRAVAWARDKREQGLPSESVELDAIASNDLRDICRDCIEQHFKEHELRTLQVAEESERDWLNKLVDLGIQEGGAR